MSVVITVIVGLVCLLGGFFAGKFYTEKNLQQGELKQQVKESKEQMAQYKIEVSSHLTVTRELTDEMKNNYNSLVGQLAKATKLLETPIFTGDANISYFANDTTAQLLSASANKPQEKRESAPLITQPFDYSDHSSGLFSEGSTTKKAQTDLV
ncbi:MAG: uncharacterized membrane-anchored protein YhcB (DUF1043 family) [Alteromonadaceae bacterium]|jgi:uncharacterized membrane-anchored protein YhcB (DUF1043 family)